MDAKKKPDPITVARIVDRLEAMAREERQDMALLADDPETLTQRMWHNIRADALLEASVEVCRSFGSDAAKEAADTERDLLALAVGS